MQRVYEHGKVRDDVTFYVGLEEDKTPAFGRKTLFVVGLHDPDKVIKYANTNGCSHIYFGANQSFDPVTPQSVSCGEKWKPWEDWEKMIKPALEANFWVTLCLDVKHVEAMHESFLCEFRRFIPQISVQIPYVQLLNHNATLKINDKGFEASNAGVWNHSIHHLTDPAIMTDWDAYDCDQIIENEKGSSHNGS